MTYWLRRHDDDDAESIMLAREGVSPIGYRITVVGPPDLSNQAVYFVQAVGGNMVKIGWVKDASKFDQRLVRIQRYCPYPVKVLYLQHNASRRDEQRAHKIFEAVHQHGEWFRIEGDLKRFLQLCAVDEGKASAAFRDALERRVLTLNF